MGWLDDLLGLGGDPAAAAATPPPSAATSLLTEDPEGLLGTKLPPMASDRTRMLRSISSGLGNVAKTMAGIAASGRKVGLGATLGAAGAAFGEGLTDIEKERFADIIQRYQLAKARQDYASMKVYAEQYKQLAAAVNGGGAAGTAPGGAQGAPGEPSIDIGDASAPAAGGASTRTPGARGGTEDMINLGGGVQVPRSIAYAAVQAGPTKFQEVIQDYLTKTATQGRWVPVPQDDPIMTPAMIQSGKLFLRNTMTNDIKPADSSTTVNVDTKGQTKFAEHYGGAMGDRAADLVAQGDNASEGLGRLDLLEKAAADYERTGGTGGEFAPIKQTLQQAYAEVFGATPDQVGNLTSAQLIEGLSTRTITDILGGKLGAGVSNADVNLVKKMVPSLSNTNPGRRKLIGISRALLQRKQMFADQWQSGDYDENDPKDWSKFQRYMRQYAREHSLADEADALTPKSSKPLGSVENPVEVKTQEELDKLPVGTFVFDPASGKIYQK